MNNSQPNYSYCIEYCPGKIANCPHLELKHGSCTHYKQLRAAVKQAHTGAGISRSGLEVAVMSMRKSGL